MSDFPIWIHASPIVLAVLNGRRRKTLPSDGSTHLVSLEAVYDEKNKFVLLMHPILAE